MNYDDDYNDYDDSRIVPIAEFNVDSSGCRTDYRTPYVITIYDIYDNGVDHIIQTLSNNIDDYCKKGVTRSHLTPSRVIPDNDYLITLSYVFERDDDEEDERIVGFAVVADMRGRTNGNDNTLYIDVICSNNELHRTRFPGGKVLLNVITEYARDNHYDSVSLKALSNVVNYYRQFGFRFLKNDETQEKPHIHELAEANKHVRLSSPSDANQVLLIERAIMFAREVDEDGVPVLNKELLRDNLTSFLRTNYYGDRRNDIVQPYNDEEVNGLLLRVPEGARYDGKGGLHDLYFSLIKGGYADLENCPGITKRQFVRPEEVNPGVWKLWMTCDDGGFQMRKILSSSETGGPIIDCDMTGGKQKRPKHKSHKPKHISKRTTKRCPIKKHSRTNPRNRRQRTVKRK